MGTARFEKDSGAFKGRDVKLKSFLAKRVEGEWVVAVEGKSARRRTLFASYCEAAGEVTFSSKEERRKLFRLYGVPNAAPCEGESPFGDCRVAFVDDDEDGKLVAFWKREHQHEG